MGDEIELPPHAPSQIDRVIQRTELLIRTGIWSGIDLNRLHSWMRMFKSLEERYLAANLLDSTIYRSERQVKACLEHLYQRRIPQALSAISELAEFSQPLIPLLMSRRRDPLIRIVPIIKDNDPPTKSGPLICRMLKRRLGLAEKWMIWPSRIPDAASDGVKLFIFVDDFLGTGDQTVKFFAAHKEHINGISTSFFLYCPIMAFTDGIHALSSATDRVNTIAAELLSDDHLVLPDREDRPFRDRVNSCANMKSLYLSTLGRLRVMKKIREPFGYNGLGMTIAFQHATPNTTLPILWHDALPSSPLFTR